MYQILIAYLIGGCDMFDEIGSEYWEADLTDGVNNLVENAVYTASGRSAQSLIIQCANFINKRVLLPAYTCQHVVEPFSWNGWEVDFYDINRNDLTVNLQSFEEKKNLDYGCIVIEGYYGFPTATAIIKYLKESQDKGTIIMEDITHSFLNNSQMIYKDADYIFCSLRKWSGLSDGGYAISLKDNSLITPTKEMHNFINDRYLARETKKEYVKSLDPKKKKKFLEFYAKSESILDHDIGLYVMSSQALGDFKKLDLSRIKEARKTNFKFYLNNIKCKYVEPIFKKLPNGVCPIMFPVYIDNYRKELRGKLIKERIYCPVHWPIPIQLDKKSKINSEQIYNNIMSIPCDQRYSIDDLKRVVEIINSFVPEVE
jgi:hypothetical protein